MPAATHTGRHTGSLSPPPFNLPRPPRCQPNELHKQGYKLINLPGRTPPYIRFSDHRGDHADGVSATGAMPCTTGQDLPDGEVEFEVRKCDLCTGPVSGRLRFVGGTPPRGWGGLFRLWFSCRDRCFATCLQWENLGGRAINSCPGPPYCAYRGRWWGPYWP